MLKRPYSYRGVPIGLAGRNLPYSGRRESRNFVSFGVVVGVALVLVGVCVFHLLSARPEEEEGGVANSTESSRAVVPSSNHSPAAGGQESSQKQNAHPGPREPIGNVPVVRLKNRTATQVQIYLLAKSKALERNGRYEAAAGDLERLFRTLPADSALYTEAKELLKRISEQVLLKSFAFKIHSVQGGESLSVISRKYKVPVKIIRQANHLRNDRIIRGQKLKIPIGKWRFTAFVAPDGKRLFLYREEEGHALLFRVFDLPAEYPLDKRVYSGNLQEYLNGDDWLDYKRYGIPNDVSISVERQK